jgi:hypothetical protein
MSDPSDFSELDRFYNFIGPRDQIGRIRPGLGRGIIDDDNLKSMSAFVLDYDLETESKHVYTAGDLNGVMPGGINNDVVATGIISAVYQAQDGLESDYTPSYKQKGTTPGKSYWSPAAASAKVAPVAPPAPGKPGKPSGSPPPAAVSIDNFYASVCAPRDQAPAREFIMTIIRSPLISLSARHVVPVETFVNHLPPLVASNMMPHFNVEFIMPQLDDEFITGDDRNASDEKYRRFLGTPSLLRFLQGSIEVDRKSLHPADASLTQTSKNFSDTRALNKVDDPVTTAPATTASAPGAKKSAAVSTSPASPGTGSPAPAASSGTSNTPKFYGPESPGALYTTGMEFFTSPQTLINMDTLQANGASKLIDSKPFLPPASIVAAAITFKNAGAGATIHTTATLDIKLHDKNRIGEFAEFLRGHSGTKRMFVRLTYGWVAPNQADDRIGGVSNRSNHYYDFINQTMMVQRDFTVMNSSFSFDAVGQVLIKVELVSKGMASIKMDTMNDSDSPRVAAASRRLQELLDKIKQNRPAFGNKPEGFEGDIRIFQILDEPLQGDSSSLKSSIPKKERELLLKKAREFIDQRANQEERLAAIDLLDDVEKYFASSQSLRTEARLEGKSFAYSKFEKCLDANSPDPFLPTANKNEALKNELVNFNGFHPDLIKAIDKVQSSQAMRSDDKYYWEQPPIAQLSAEEQKALDAKIEADKRKGDRRRVVSFGKVFSVFALPAILRIAKDEDIDSVKINFFQMNESCGPMSGINISEFPIDMDMFLGQFADFVAKRGGEAMTLEEFMSFVAETQFADRRSPGYAMSEYYLPYSPVRPQLTQRPDEQVKPQGGGGGGGGGGPQPQGLNAELQMWAESPLKKDEAVQMYIKHYLTKSGGILLATSYNPAMWKLINADYSSLFGGPPLVFDDPKADKIAKLQRYLETKPDPKNSRVQAESIVNFHVNNKLDDNDPKNQSLKKLFNSVLQGKDTISVEFKVNDEKGAPQPSPIFTELKYNDAYNDALDARGGEDKVFDTTRPQADRDADLIFIGTKVRTMMRKDFLATQQAAAGAADAKKQQEENNARQDARAKLTKTSTYAYSQVESSVTMYKAFAFVSPSTQPSKDQLTEFNKLNETEQGILIDLLKDPTQPADTPDSKGQPPPPNPPPASTTNVAFSLPSAEWYEKNSKKKKAEDAKSRAAAGAAAAAAETADAKRWKFANAIGDWFTKWGNLKIPGIAMRVDTMPEGDPIVENLSEKFRLNLTNSEIKTNYKGKSIVMRIDIYDTAASAQHAKLTPSGLLDSNATLEPKTVTVTKGVKGGKTNEVIMQRKPPAYTTVEEKGKDKVALGFTASGGNLQTETFEKYGGLKVLEKFVEPRTGRLHINTNGSLIYNVQLASKTDSLLSTAHMQAGSFKTRSTLAPNGLQMEEYNLPIRVLPAQLSMNVKGCPLIEPYQEYLVDFDTGTSIDNVYSVIQVTHNISLGKFDTSLTFTPIDGYARVISYMNDLERQIEKATTSSPGPQTFAGAGASLVKSAFSPFSSTTTPTEAAGTSGTNSPGAVTDAQREEIFNRTGG